MVSNLYLISIQNNASLKTFEVKTNTLLNASNLYHVEKTIDKTMADLANNIKYKPLLFLNFVQA